VKPVLAIGDGPRFFLKFFSNFGQQIEYKAQTYADIPFREPKTSIVMPLGCAGQKKIPDTLPDGS